MKPDPPLFSFNDFGSQARYDPPHSTSLDTQLCLALGQLWVLSSRKEAVAEKEEEEEEQEESSDENGTSIILIWSTGSCVDHVWGVDGGISMSYIPWSPLVPSRAGIGLSGTSALGLGEQQGLALALLSFCSSWTLKELWVRTLQGESGSNNRKGIEAWPIQLLMKARSLCFVAFKDSTDFEPPVWDSGQPTLCPLYIGMHFT
ncbi:hypothetical protein DUI87_09814 [Hirundo rustica rustica]|uniref:Uncharacterized protein n=1 Tax=Hirundo rustica rustica TaxID=333673 RepID=A0A3M0KI48_HIRRU|nr:hypothetical protein DUI87_09814 [Hirundo rustica rustica]